MCGIGGIIGFDQAPLDPQELVTISSFMKERGPDAEGFWSHGSLGLCHRRLAIVDLRPESNQPMLFGEELALVFNGEIYNFKGLKRELEAQGARFRTESDTEVLGVGYQHWGIEGLVQKCEGMFAFALLDQQQGVLHLARDRFGKKPLYVYQAPHRLIFASDIRSIWALERPQLSLDFDALSYYLCEIAVPQPRTIWRQIRQVPAAHYQSISLQGQVNPPRRYWQLPLTWEDVSTDSALERIESLLRDCILKRTFSDVPLGCFLSGGIDSGLVVALLAEQSKQKVKTFTVGLKDSPMDESADAKLVADRYQTEHHQLMVEPDILTCLPELIDYCGEPFADSSLLPSYYICQSLRQHVTVALSGDGGDELFGGYREYVRAWKGEQLGHQHPSKLQRTLAVTLDKVRHRIGRGRSGPNLGAAAEDLAALPPQRMFRALGFSPRALADLVQHPEIKRSLGFFEFQMLQSWQRQLDPKSETSTLMRASLEHRLLNDYLVKVDRASMCSSLEVRSPFLDHRLAELAFSLPPQLKFQEGQSKYLLKRLAQQWLDPNIFARPKRGFSIPLHDWLRGKMRGFVEPLLFNGRSIKQGFFQTQQVQNLWKRHLSGEDHTHSIWALCCLEIWLQKFA
jgi:asparagine synthase (glutamine-hydrolysing)